MSTNDKEKPYEQGWHPSVTANHATRTAENEAAILLPRLKPTSHILDLGCGPGTITTGLAQYVPQGSITGVDLTPEIIAQAEQLAEQQEGGAPKNVKFSTGNVLEGLPFENETFDVVWMSQVLIHIPEPVKALKELRRVLKTGGFIADREGDFPFHWYPYLPGLQLKSKYQVRNFPPSNCGLIHTYSTRWSSHGRSRQSLNRIYLRMAGSIAAVRWYTCGRAKQGSIR
ncbi:hypothetical protein PMIN06_001774 [Paraphaeosphaeria minitans]